MISNGPAPGTLLCGDPACICSDPDALPRPAHCPFHPEGPPTLSPVTFRCESGCAPEAIRDLLGVNIAKRSTGGTLGDLGNLGTPMGPAPPGIVCLADVPAEPVRWLWPLRIPLGKLCVIDGDPGLGKSTLTLDIAARVTKGSPMPDGSRGDMDGPASVLLLTAEDGAGDTVRPRLDAAGGDPRRVYVEERSAAALLNLADVEWLRVLLDAMRPALVIIDPLAAYLPSSVDAFKDADVRRLLAPLSRLAEEKTCAITIVRHLNKAGGMAAVYRGGGSIGIIGAARSGLLVAKHPDAEGLRVLASIKSNLGPAPPALAFGLEDAGGHPVIRWAGEVAYSADRLLAPPVDTGGARADAVAFLEAELADGPVPAAEIFERASAAGIAKRTLDRAKQEAGVESRRDGTDGAWTWRLKERHEPP